MLSRIARWIFGVVILQGVVLAVLAWLLPGLLIEGVAALIGLTL